MNSWLFNSILNFQPVPNVQLVIQQYIELPAYSQLAVYSAVYSISSQVCMYSWLFNSVLNNQPVPNVQLVIQQYIGHSWLYMQLYIQLPARSLRFCQLIEDCD